MKQQEHYYEWCFSNMVHFRVTLDLEINNETGVCLIKAEAYEMEKQCEMRQK